MDGHADTISAAVAEPDGEVRPPGIIPNRLEGFFDCFKLYQAGVASVALMGSALYDAQRRALLQSSPHVTLMLDGDEAGRRATATIAARLRPYTSVSVVHLPDSVQPDQLSAAEIRQVLQAHTGPAMAGRLC